MKFNKEITRSDLNELEEYLDRIYSKLGIDVEFTYHFIDRVNDARNIKPININELRRLFKQAQKYHGKKIAQMGPDADAILKDMKTNVNIPFVLEWDPKEEELDLVAKTVMRKRDFKTHDPEFTVEKKEDPEDKISSIDATTAPLIKKAMARFPTAKNELQALVKFVQNELKDDGKDINRLDTENDDQYIELDKDDVMITQNKEVITQILDRLDKLEQETGQQALQQMEGYNYIHKELDEVIRNNISKNNWSGYHPGDHTDLMDNGKQVGKIDGFEVWLLQQGYDRVVYLIHRSPKSQNYDKIVGEFELGKWGKNRWETFYSKLDRKVQGKGLGYKVYMFLMKELGYTLVTGESHSVGAEKTWQKLVKNPRVLAWVQAPGKRKKHSVQFDKETDELEGYVEPYLQGSLNWIEDERESKLELRDIERQYQEDEITDAEYKRKKKQWVKKWETAEQEAGDSEGARIFAMYTGGNKVQESIDKIEEINVGPSQEPADINDKRYVLSLPIIDQSNSYDVRSSKDNTWVAFTKDTEVISVIIIGKHNSGHKQLTKTWTNEKHRSKNISGDLIVYAVKELKISPLLSDDTMSPEAIGRFQKILNSNKLEVSIWDQEENIKIPYSTKSPVYNDILKKLKSNITNTGATMREGDKYVWIMEKWNGWDNKQNYLGEGMLTKQTEYFLPKSSDYKFIEETGRISPFVQTDDVNASEIIPHAAAFNNVVDEDGFPPLMNGEKQQRTRSRIEYPEKEHDDFVNCAGSLSFKSYLKEFKVMPDSDGHERAKEWPTAFWYSPDRHKIIPTNNIDHTDAVLNAGDWKFDIPEDEFNAMKERMHKIHDTRHINDNVGWDTEVIELANKHGWVRAGSDRMGGFFFQSNNPSDLHKSVKAVYDTTTIDKVYIDTEVASFMATDYGEPLRGKELEYYVKRGKFMPKQNKSRLAQFVEAKDYSGRDKLWIHPESGKTVDVRGSHHTVHAYENPQKYGLSGGIFASHTPQDVDGNQSTLYDEGVASVMYDNGWVRYHVVDDGKANLQSHDFETVAKALQWLRKNNRQFDEVFAATIDDYVTLDNPRDIKNFARTGKKPVSKMNQFREEDLNEALTEPSEYEWYKDTHEWQSKFSTKSGLKVSVGMYGHRGNTWEIDFSTNAGDGYYNLGITNKGDAFEIFSTVIAMLHDFIKQMSPMKITFSASKDDRNRAKLYKRMISKFIGMISYTVDVHDNGQDIDFVLSKTGEAVTEASPHERLRKAFNNPTKNISKQDVQDYMKKQTGYGYLRGIGDQMGPHTPSIQDIAKQHDVHEDQIAKELQKGIAVELEHTEDLNLANEIARDHLAELPDYYTRLDKMENESLNEFKMVPVVGADTHAYINPTASDLKALLDKFSNIRGSYREKTIYIWNAYELTHDEMQDTIPPLDGDDFDFFLTNAPEHDKEFDEWDRTYEIAPGIWAEFYGEDASIATKTPMFKRMLPKSISEAVETVERHDGKEVKVLVNPNLTALTRMFKASSYGELRGLHDDNQFYFWDGGDLIHNAMADLLGLPYTDQSRLDLYTTRERKTILNHDEAAYDTLEQSRWVNSLFNAQEVSGWPEFVLKEQIEEDLDDNIDLKNIIKQIDPKLQEIIAMRYDHDMTYAEIAKEIGKSQDWARQLVLKAQRRIKAVMIANNQSTIEEETLELPDLETGDEIKVGKFKNRKAEIKGFKKDKNNHPVAKTDKGDQQILKPRITKLMPEE